nr:MAG TPA: hypothetical protein [Caudoviricetes sp.]
MVTQKLSNIKGLAIYIIYITTKYNIYNIF